MLTDLHPVAAATVSELASCRRAGRGRISASIESNASAMDASRSAIIIVVVVVSLSSSDCDHGVTGLALPDDSLGSSVVEPDVGDVGGRTISRRVSIA